MEGGPSQTKIPSPLSRDTLEEKLAKASPIINSTLIDPQMMFKPSRPRSRSGRPRNRRRSFASIEISNPLLSNLSTNHSSIGNFINHSNSTCTLDDTPNNSIHSWSRPDTQTTSVTTELLKEHATPKSKGRPVRQRAGFRNRRRSFDPTLLSRTLMAQAVSDSHQNRSAIDAKLAMTSPNNNNTNSNNRMTTSSRGRSPSRRRRNRRRSMPQLVLPPLLLLTENLADKNLGKDEECDEQVPIADSSGHGRRQNASNSLPSSSGHSGWSYYTEMTVHTDTHLLSNDQEDPSDSSDDSSTCYYSDGGIPAYENKLQMSLAISVDDDEYDEEDDSSNSKFNYEGRDNGSLKTLESAFSLGELGSNDSVSSLSLEDDDDDGNFEIEESRRIQFLLSPVTPSRQRQQRRSSYQPIGRRRRRPSDESDARSGDEYEEVTEEEDPATDDDIPDIPKLPNQVFNENPLNKNSQSTNEYVTEDDQVVEEEVTEVEVETDYEHEEYIEEISLNDVSQKRYEIMLSQESFEEEILLDGDDDEEEITVEDDDLFYYDSLAVDGGLVSSADYQYDVKNNTATSNEDGKSKCIAGSNDDVHADAKNKDASSNTHVKSVCGEDDRAGDLSENKMKHDLPNVTEKGGSNAERSDNNSNEDCTLNIDEKNGEFVLGDDANKTRHDGDKRDAPQFTMCDNIEESKDLKNEDAKNNAGFRSKGENNGIVDCENGIIPNDNLSRMNEDGKCSTSNQSNSESENASATVHEKTKFRADVKDDDDQRKTQPHFDENGDVSDNHLRNCSNKDTSLMMIEKTYCGVHFDDSENKNENGRNSFNDIGGKPDFKDCRSSVDKKTIGNGERLEERPDGEEDYEQKTVENNDKNSECSSGYLGDDKDCEKPKSYRDILMGP